MQAFYYLLNAFININPNKVNAPPAAASKIPYVLQASIKAIPKTNTGNAIDKIKHINVNFALDTFECDF